MSNLSNLLSSWRAEPTVGGNICDWKSIPARNAKFVPIPEELNSTLAASLKASGIQYLYTHQFVSWQMTKNGQNIVVVSGTASGKSLCYNLPILDHLLLDRDARALYLFPTKALAQDQLFSIESLIPSTISQIPENSHFRAAIYDGDTPARIRSSIRKNTQLLISNPDMLHTSILPHHTDWADFFSRLKYIVVDETHAYRGVFGSHVANVFRRLKRICKYYSARPQFILTSATIANPGEFATRLIEEKINVIDEDGSYRGPQYFLTYNPPLVNEELGIRRSALQECVRLADDLLAYNLQTIIFGRSRRTVELILTYLREKISPQGDHFKTHSNQITIRGYRSGYLPRERRDIERGLRQRQIQAVVATNALELGINIGNMEAAILVGYPGTISSTWQQAGRAGRGPEPSLALFIATADPLDQYLAKHTDFIHSHPIEYALINPDNPLLLLDHIRCAAFEYPFQHGERFSDYQDFQLEDYLEFLVDEGALHKSTNRYYWMTDQYPARNVSLRNISADNILLQGYSDGKPITIGDIDYTSSLWMTHPGAIYLHEGSTYIVDELDLEQKIAWLEPIETDYYTVPQLDSNVILIEEIAKSSSEETVKAYGEINVSTQVTGYRKIRWFTHEPLSLHELDLPATELVTTGYWLSLTEKVTSYLRDSGLWKNDPNRYGPNWEIQRDRARARDRYTCQVCGLKETNRSHDVHHITPFKAFIDIDGIPNYKQANRLDNLSTLCPKCHRRAESAVKVRSGLAGLGYALGHLTPLFLMCDSRDLGIHTDPKSLLSGGRPTVVIYDQIPAGIGFSQQLFELHDDILYHAHTLISTCTCNDGCPSCVGPGGENGTGGKLETLAILDTILPRV
jgi:DEAD/DEAH box helicase domain-containing protein